MKKYSTQSKCKKCGTQHYQLGLCQKCEKSYSKEMISSVYYKVGDRFEINGKYFDAPHACILRTCQNCGYQWVEYPVDKV